LPPVKNPLLISLSCHDRSELTINPPLDISVMFRDDNAAHEAHGKIINSKITQKIGFI